MSGQTRSYIPIASAAAIAVLVLSVAVFYSYGTSSSGCCSSIQSHTNSISVSGLSICPSNCIYPAPYVSALVTFNASVPVSSLEIYVNNTYDGTDLQNPVSTTVACSAAAGQTCSVELGGTSYSSGTYASTTEYYATCSVPANSTSCPATYAGSANTLTVFAYQYKGSLPNNFIPVVAGDTYVFKFVAVFQDGSMSTTTFTVVAT